ncbi:MAG TPA: hypothetical protein VGE92_05120 [Steroidobacteraceae bacterium]|jgi:hypothetical protein
MRSINSLLILLSIGGVASQALAADPPSPPAQNATAAATPAAPAVSSASTSPATPAAAPTAAKTDAATSGSTETQVKTLRAAGYKPETHNGQTLWCRREAQIGTRFETKSCGTADDLERQTKESQDMTARVQQKNVFNPKSN